MKPCLFRARVAGRMEFKWVCTRSNPLTPYTRPGFGSTPRAAWNNWKEKNGL